MKPHKQPEQSSVGAYLSALGGKILVGKKDRQDTERNRKRLEEAALASRELGVQRIADEEIKKLTADLAYEVDGYIAAARESEDAFYEPLVLDALDAARAALNTWKKNENDAAAGKYIGAGGTGGGIVIPGTGQIAADGEMHERTLGVLRESLRLFIIKNTIRTAGDPESALAALAVQYPERIP